ncbi:MAG TPA: hypothetical protein VLS91_03655 [Acidimicrobiales bacterium]|nr:hypothetical protein [Acidimicrobiales bacterium]
MRRHLAPVLRSVVATLAVTLVTASAVTSLAAASTLGPTNAQRRALATFEARHLFTLVTLPSGSREVARSNPAIDRTLLSMGARSADPDQVDLTRFYLVTRGPWALNWLESHVPVGGTRSGWGTGSGPGQPTSHTLTFSFVGPPVLSSVQLQYSMVISPSGELGLRVDANVLWTPRKSPFSLIASGATKVVVTMDRGFNVRNGRVTTVTIDSRATIASIRTTLNGLPVATPGVASCPIDVGALMTLTFWRAGSTSPFAKVAADPGGCGAVTVSQLDSHGTVIGVGQDSGGWRFVRSVARELSIKDWTGQI